MIRTSLLNSWTRRYFFPHIRCNFWYFSASHPIKDNFSQSISASLTCSFQDLYFCFSGSAIAEPGENRSKVRIERGTRKRQLVVTANPCLHPRPRKEVSERLETFKSGEENGKTMMRQKDDEKASSSMPSFLPARSLSSLTERLVLCGLLSAHTEIVTCQLLSFVE